MLLTFLLFATAFVCLAVPVSIYLRMVITRRRVVAEIHAHMSEHRRTCCGHRTAQREVIS